MSEATPEGHHHKEGGNGLDLMKKVGPLPTWGWAVIVIAVYFAYRHHAVSKAASTNANTTVPNDGTGQISGNALGGSGSGGGGTNSANGTNVPPTNQSWILSAISTLTAQGKYSASDINTALVDWGTGGALSTPYQAIVNDALTQLGPPPNPIPVNKEAPVTTVPVPPSTSPQPLPGDTFMSGASTHHGPFTPYPHP